MTLQSEQSPRTALFDEGSCSAAQQRGTLSGLPTAEGISDEFYEFAGFRLFPRRRTLLRGDQRIAIGGRALDLLLLLVTRAGNVVSLEDLMRLVWPNVTVEEANVRVQMALLRKVLAQCDEANPAIDTVPNRGYCFVLSVRHHSNEVEPDSSRLPRHPALPMLPNPTVGRDDAIQIIEAALERHRLVTVTGPGGIGKTTVAVATSQRYAQKSQGLIRFIDLSYARDGSGAAQVISGALHLASNYDPLEARSATPRNRR